MVEVAAFTAEEFAAWLTGHDASGTRPSSLRTVSYAMACLHCSACVAETPGIQKLRQDRIGRSSRAAGFPRRTRTRSIWPIWRWRTALTLTCHPSRRMGCSSCSTQRPASWSGDYAIYQQRRRLVLPARDNKRCVIPLHTPAASALRGFRPGSRDRRWWRAWGSPRRRRSGAWSSSGSCLSGSWASGR